MIIAACAKPAGLAQDVLMKKWYRRPALTGLLATLAVSLLITACGSPAGPAHDHGRVAGHLTIPFVPAATTGKAEIIPISVTVGERFSIKVDTSDGPYWWTQSGTAPDPRLVRLAGNFNDGSCSPGLVGCRVPFFHTLFARARGTTAMSWRYHSPGCAATTGTATPPGRACPPVTLVTFTITIR
jgi:hypothetical protein